MTLAIGILLLTAAAAYVVAPFFSAESSPRPVAVPPRQSLERDALERQKLDGYTAIKEAEFDLRMGKLSDADFNATRDKYAAQALEAIAALEALEAAQPRMLADARRPARIAFCPMCGHAVPPRANFCPACGRALKEKVA
jgi:rubrerythrin